MGTVVGHDTTWTQHDTTKAHSDTINKIDNECFVVSPSQANQVSCMLWDRPVSYFPGMPFVSVAVLCPTVVSVVMSVLFPCCRVCAMSHC